MTGRTTDLEVPVLIVGGGGAGLTASLLLSQLGVDSLLISTWPGTSRLPKAHLLNQRTMEIFRGAGADDVIYERGTPPENMAYTAWYAGMRGDGPDFGRRYGRMESWGRGGQNPAWAAASPCRQTNLPQIRLEPLLRQRAEELGRDRLRFNHEAILVEQDDEGVTTTVRDKTAGTEYRVRSRFLLGCDGGRFVGPSAGITLDGIRDANRTASVHFTSDLSAWAADDDVLIRWIRAPHVGLGVTLVPLGPDHWGAASEEWVCHVNYPPDDDRALDDKSVEADLRAALGLPGHPIDIHVISRWVTEGVVADRFRDGRIFLLGDAAHRHPPTGGLGLNSAVQDAHNIAWKLAAVLAGHAGEDLLATYEAERRPTTTRNVERALVSAANHHATDELIGLSPTATAEENWASLRRIWSGRAEDAELSGAVRRAMAAQSLEFDEHNVEYGYTYESGAIIPDGSAQRDNPDPVRIYQPGTRPGEPLPHAWLEDFEGHRLPVMDLVRPGHFLLIAGEHGAGWAGAADKVATELRVPLDVAGIGHLDGTFFDPNSTWTRYREITDRGAVLVRPDRFVAWRSSDEVADPAAELTAALTRILALPAAD